MCVSLRWSTFLLQLPDPSYSSTVLESWRVSWTFQNVRMQSFGRRVTTLRDYNTLPHVWCSILLVLRSVHFFWDGPRTTDSILYSTKCIIWEILCRLTPRSACRDHASASYGRSKSTVVDLKIVSDPWGGVGRGGRFDCAQQTFILALSNDMKLDRTMTSWKVLRN